jgi:hypothetical protein
MSVEVCTVWAPRPNHEKWRDDYLDLLALQRKTALQFGHVHTVVTDGAALPGFDCLQVRDMPESLMKAMIDGVLARLNEPVHSNLLFVDVDVLIGRSLDEAFPGTFDLGLTFRDHPTAPINNGAMYVSHEGARAAKRFFCRAMELCGDHWGGDQEAISQAAMPVPAVECTKERQGARVAFLSMKTHSVVPKAFGKPHTGKPFSIHFKGETKPWAATYAERFILRGEKSASAII